MATPSSLTAVPGFEVGVVVEVVILVDMVSGLCDVVLPLVGSISVMIGSVVKLIGEIAVGACISICVDKICGGRLVVYSFPRAAANDDRCFSICWSTSVQIVS